MLDIKFIRENKEIVQMGAQKKHVDIKVDDLLLLDDKRKEILSSIEKKARRAKRYKYKDSNSNRRGSWQDD